MLLRRFTLALLFVLGFALVLPNTNQAAALGPVVHVILYWQEGCPACERVLQEVLPELQAQYDDQLEAELIEVVSLEDIDQLYKLGESYGLAKEQTGVPFLLIGDTALVGWVEISTRLPALIEDYLAQGGVDTQVRELGQESELVLADSLVFEDEPVWSGMPLAWVLEGFMLLVLGFTVWGVWQAFQGSLIARWPGWVWNAIPALALLGLGVAIYMTYIEATYTPAFCGPVGDCNAVQTSRYSRIFDVIPVGLFGAVGYLGILAAWIYPRLRNDSLSEYAPIAILGMAGFGVIYSVYLTYLEIFVIKAVCIWCLSSAILITLILLAGLSPALTWLGQEEEEEP